MKNNRIIITVIFLLIINVLHSQIPVGLKFDLNGKPFNGYFDPLTYSPEKELWIVHNSDSYEVGYYYDHGAKIHGQIMFENKKIWFKKNKDALKTKIKPDEIKYFVIGVDSFFVINNFQYKGQLKTKPEFVQYITEVYGDTYVKYYRFSSGMGIQYGATPIIESFLVKAKGSNIWEEFPDDIRFKKTALKYFGFIPYLKDKIVLGDYTREDMMSMIKMAEYFETYQNNELIYFDTYWQEINNSENATYHARIADFEDSRWTFIYFKDSTKLYKANYSSFYPNTKDGAFILYYPNGEVRKIIGYTEDEPTEVWIFNDSGEMKYHYQLVETKKNSNPEAETITNIVYNSIIDSLEKNLIGSSDRFEQVVYDEYANVTYTNQFYEKELVTSYRLINKDTIFQITNPAYFFKIKPLQKKLNSFMVEKDYKEALSVDAQGRILVSFVIDNKGYMVDYVILNRIHPQLDELIESFINKRIAKSAEYRHKFKPYKKDKTKQFCELVIPFNFGINRFYRQPNYYNNNLWQMQQMQMQMYQQQMINNYTAPNIPTGF